MCESKQIQINNIKQKKTDTEYKLVVASWEGEVRGEDRG